MAVSEWWVVNTGCVRQSSVRRSAAGKDCAAAVPTGPPAGAAPASSAPPNAARRSSTIPRVDAETSSKLTPTVPSSTRRSRMPRARAASITASAFATLTWIVSKNDSASTGSPRAVSASATSVACPCTDRAIARRPSGPW